MENRRMEIPRKAKEIVRKGGHHPLARVMPPFSGGMRTTVSPQYTELAPGGAGNDVCDQIFA
jgi:hypothetical protein